MNEFQRQLAVMKGLSLRKKVQHIWIYYRWWILAGIAVLACLVSLVTTLRYNRMEQMISGMFLNNAASQECYDHLTQDYVEFCGGGNRRAELVEGRVVHFEEDPLPQEDAAALMVVAGMYSAKTLDYIITDAASVPYLDKENILLDLRELLPEEMLTQYGTIEGQPGPIALRLDKDFAQQYGLYSDDSCIVILKSIRDRDKVLRFLNYLLP